MKKRSLIVVLLLSAMLLQFCKKSETTDTTTTTTGTAVLFNSYINGTLSTPKTVTATFTYDATAKTKTFVCTAIDTVGTGKIVLTLKQPATTLDSTLTVQTYTADVTTYTPMYFLSNVAVGTVQAGYFTVSAIDAVKKNITGTFALTTTKLNYDSNGNLVSITANNVSNGQFNALPYTYKKQ